MSKDNEEEFCFNSKDYMKLVNESDRNNYFTEDEDIKKDISIRDIRTEIIEKRIQVLLKGKTRWKA